MSSVDELLDALMKDCKNPEDIVGENGLLGKSGGYGSNRKEQQGIGP